MRWLVTATIGGLLALFSMYWDDSLHTDEGRDTFWSAPHVLLYGSLTGTLVMVAGWVLSQARDQGLRTAVADPLLRWAAAAGGAIGIAAPADAAWHTAFGRDSVLWSPPHLLAITATFTLSVVLLRAIAGEGGGRSIALGSALVLAASLAPVMEYESDVPQFSEVWFLPVVAVGVTLAALLIRRFDPQPWAFTRAALLVTAVRLLVVPVLALLGYSTPMVPLVLGVAVAADLVRRRVASPWALAAVVPVMTHLLSLPLLPLLPHATAVPLGLAIPSLLLSLAGSAVAVLAAEGRPRAWITRVAAITAVTGLLALQSLASPERAVAHDPGQGVVVGEVRWDASVRGSVVDVAVALTPAGPGTPALVARRAGREVTGMLAPDDAGGFRGAVTLHDAGRWFVYAVLRDPSGRAVESWIPVDLSAGGTVRETRDLYLPAAPEQAGAGRTAAAVALYGLSGALLLLTSRSGRGRPHLLPGV